MLNESESVMSVRIGGPIVKLSVAVDDKRSAAAKPPIGRSVRFRMTTGLSGDLQHEAVEPGLVGSREKGRKLDGEPLRRSSRGRIRRMLAKPLRF